MFQTGGDPVWICGCITGCHCQSPGLRAAEFTTRFPPWKEWVIPAYNKNWVAVWCVFICVRVCTWKCQWAGLAAAAEKGNGIKGEQSREEWRCYKPGTCTKGPLCWGGRWVTHSLSHTHLPQPAATTSPWGTFHSEAAQRERGEVI